MGGAINPTTTTKNKTIMRLLTDKEINDLLFEAHLSEVTIKQLTWKPDINRNIAIAITNYAVAKRDQEFWTDEVPLPEYDKSDSGCVGPNWKRLANVGIIKSMNKCRRSDIKLKPSRRGGKAFCYRLDNLAKALTFLKRNKVVPADPQQELGIEDRPLLPPA